MHPKFREAVDALHSKFELLLGSSPHRPGAKLPKKGVYLFCEKGKPQYVGRSDNIPARRTHHRSAATNKAALSRLIACDELGLKRDYGTGRDKFKNAPGFAAAFKQARIRVHAMEFRAVEECDPTRQALLEVYCAVAAGTKFNDFGNH